MNTAEIRRQANAAIKGKHFKTILIFLLYMLFTVVGCLIPFIGSIFIMVMSIPLSYGLTVSIIKLKRNENVGYFDFVSIAFSEFSNAWRVTFSMLGKLWPYLLGYFASFMFMIFGSVFASILGIATSAIIDSSSSADFTALIPMLIVFGIGGIAGIIFYVLLLLKSLYYSLSYYVLYDNKELKGKEIVEKSYELMLGNRWNLVKMQIPYYLIAYGLTILVAILPAILAAIFETPIFIILTYLLMYAPIIIITPMIQFAITQFYDTITNNEYQNITYTENTLNPITENNSNVDSNTNPKKGFGIAALVLGIISILTICVMPLSIICGILAVIFGIIALFKGGKGFGITGLITGFLGIILSIVVLVFFGVFSVGEAIFDEIKNEIDTNNSIVVDNTINKNSTTNKKTSKTNALTLKNTTIEFDIPSDYKLSNSYNSSYSASKYWNSKDNSISVTCRLNSYNSDTAEEYLNSQVKYDEDNKNYASSGIKTTRINNKEIKYLIWQYGSSSSKVQKIAAIYILPNNYCYTVTATTYDDEVILDLNTISEFLTIQ